MNEILREGRSIQVQFLGLTLKMESFLVDGDGESAVIFVIDPDHSSLFQEK